MDKIADNCRKKKYVLGVSFEWGLRKGQDVFIALRKKLDSSYCIVMVGTDGRIGQELPHGIVPVHRTRNQKELAEIYTASDVFVNPTRDEVLGMVNLEALACGTPVVTFQAGGSPECIDRSCGVEIPVDDMDDLVKQIKNICENRIFSKKACTKRAELFSNEVCCRRYLDLYNKVSTHR